MAGETQQVKKIVVNRELCIGAASCTVLTPDLFELDADNKAIIKIKTGTKNSSLADRSELIDGSLTDALIIESAKSCPTRAIALLDEAGQLIPL